MRCIQQLCAASRIADFLWAAVNGGLFLNRFALNEMIAYWNYFHGDQT
jgi:hypothetical protein